MSSAYFFTATILHWIPILEKDAYKKIITDSLAFLVVNKRAKIHAFVIMPNHIHLIWQPIGEHRLANIQRDFLKFTSQQIQKDLRTNYPDIHRKFEVNLKDRRYQLWQRNPLNVELHSREIFEQKIDYIHGNPVQGKWMLCDDFTDYEFSSANYYEEGDERYTFLSHYMEYFGY